ncbi:MAG: PIN domain-containing protein [Bryobacteraceae bacterium]|jgi:predicted nucleic acid-binding protein
MKKVLIDTNVVLDVLLDRQPHAAGSVAIWAAVETRFAQGLLAAHAITTVHYVMRRELGTARATRTIGTILRVFGVAAVDGPVIQLALGLPVSDFEDAVTAAAAQFAGCDYIVTRDPKGFRGCGVQSLAPEAAATLFGGG